MNFYLTQFLTGHGCFKSYVKRIGKTASDLCEVCREDSPGHILQCKVWAAEKIRLEQTLKIEISKENLIALMMENERNWNEISNYIAQIVKEKEKKELEGEGRK